MGFIIILYANVLSIFGAKKLLCFNAKMMNFESEQFKNIQICIGGRKYIKDYVL